MTLSLWAACRHAQPDVDLEQRDALVEALGPIRLLEGRLTGLRFAPLRRDGRRPAPRDDEAWRRAANEVEARLQDQRTPAALANLALVKLATEDPAKALEALEEAVALPRASAWIWSDLAAVRLAEAASVGNPHLLVTALEAADRAVQLDPRLSAALFNRAKIAERLSLRSLAKSDWQRYQRLDAGSGWATEARASLEALRPPSLEQAWAGDLPRLQKAVEAGDGEALAELAALYPVRTRESLEAEVFPAWTAAIADGDSRQATRWDAVARALSSRLYEVTGDRLDADAAAAIQGVPPSVARELAVSHRDFAEGVRLYDQGNYSPALRLFARALPAFERARSPFSLAARLKIAACEDQTGDWQRARAEALGLLAKAKSHTYRSLVGRIDWLIGLVDLEGGKADPAQTRFREALGVFQQIHDPGSEASIDSLLANCAAYLGTGDDAWPFRLRAQAIAADAGDPWAMTTVFSAAARALLREAKPAEAELFQAEAQPVAEASKDIQRIAEAHWGRATIYRRANDLALARTFIAEAGRDCDRISDPRAARPTRAGVDAEAGQIWLDADPWQAVRLFTEALELYEGYAYSRTEIFLGRALAHRKLGEDADAERDLLDAVDEYERQRAGIQPGPLRATYFETARQVFEELIALEVERGDARAAFDHAERSKARVLLDSLASRRLAPPGPLTAADVPRGLPSGMALVEYAVLKDRVVSWVWSPKLAFHSVPWDRTELQAEVAGLARSIAVPSGDSVADLAKFEQLSGYLYGRLIGPLLVDVPAGATLVLVPDDELREVPFAALLDRPRRRFLVERNPLIVAPSATIFLAPSARRPSHRRSRDRWRSLAVGGAAIDAGRFPEHGLLPQTKKEAEEIAAAHPGALLVERDATVPRFLAALDRFEFVHFAGHAGVSPTAGRPALLFTPSPGRYEAGALDAEAIAALRLSRPRLAVLAACGAAGGGGLSLEGGDNLVRSFFEAGVPAVLGNLWSLGDAEAKVFLEAFYGNFWQGRSAATALQRAQIAMIHHRHVRFHRPAVWGGFRLLGTTGGQGLP